MTLFTTQNNRFIFPTGGLFISSFILGGIYGVAIMLGIVSFFYLIYQGVESGYIYG